MKLMNYMNLNQYPVQLSFHKNRTEEFVEIYHAHQGMEFLYVHEGHGHVIVERQIYELRPGCLFYFRPFQLHRVRMTDLAAYPYVRSLFVFEPTVLEAVLQMFPLLQGFFRKVWKEPDAMQRLDGLDTAEFEALLRTHAALLEAAPPERRLEDQQWFLGAVLQRMRMVWPADEAAGRRLPRTRSSAGGSRGGGGASSIAETLMEWLEVHYMEPFELGALAQHVHLSPNHVSSLFRKSVGSSITEYIAARRIRQACWLLRTTDQAVREIGEAVGLHNFSYFCQAFKKHVGVSPHQFRKQMTGSRV
ncbi:helix-turn-helix transcriptional regulator [Paenibacillus koleovorans]|uniref:helix-turn-helix transcriptional regulator n=1 Tax=Paenibacillus koleovorans TaxID=121608 RepID=UPI000FD871BE|nr:AraC family transcriptional regulator [Paenibacillus koleovorans]